MDGGKYKVVSKTETDLVFKVFSRAKKADKPQAAPAEKK